MERLSCLIQYEILHQRSVPFKTRNFQASHVLSVDDVVLFGAATLANLSNMISTLKKQASSLGINILKSRLIFP